MSAIDLVGAPLDLPEATIVVNTVSDRRAAGSAPVAPPTLAPQRGTTILSYAPAPWAAGFDTAGALPVDAIEQIIRQWR
jgi:hypothetical protein